MNSQHSTERKYISVMICDIAGSYEFLYEQDPEYGKRILDEAISNMVEIVERFDGNVTQVQGDGLMVLFGAPESLEDHAERACRAAVAMIETFTSANDEGKWPNQARINPKIGISSGEAVVGESMPHASSMGGAVPEYIAVGAVSHLAGKLQKAARPNEIVISEATAAIVSPVADIIAADDINVHEQIPDHPRPYLLQSVSPSKSRWEIRRSRYMSPFVGREAELVRLGEFARGALTRQAQVVGISGQAGIGKSRLTHEFVERSGSVNFNHLGTYCERIDQNIAFKPIRYLILQWLGLDHDVSREKILSALRKRVTSEQLAGTNVTEALAQVFNIDIDNAEWNALEPDIRRKQSYNALLQWINALAANRPVLLVFEDLHWADHATESFIRGLAQQRLEVPLFVLVTYRDGYGGNQHLTEHELFLSTLSGSDSASIAEANYLDGELSTAKLSHILQRCAGVPLYIEEISRSMHEQQRQSASPDLSTESVPDFLRVIIASRVDILPEDARELLKIASVSESRFFSSDIAPFYPGKKRNMNKLLAYLQDAHLIQPGEQADEYRFTHGLFQEVVYRSIVNSEKIRLHSQVLENLKRTQRASGNELLMERLCHHAVRAEAWPDVVEFASVAARNAMQNADYESAVHFYALVLKGLKHTDNAANSISEAQCLLELSRAYIPLGRIQESFDLLEHCKTSIEGGISPQLECEVGMYETCLFALLKDARSAMDAGEKALLLANEQGSDPLTLGATTYLAQAVFFHADFQRVVDLLEPLVHSDSIARFGQVKMGNSAAVAVDTYGILAMAYAQLGEFEPAVAYGERSLSVAEEVGGSFNIALANFYLTYILVHQGEMARSQHSLERVKKIIEAGGIRFLSPWLSGLLGFIHAKEGHQRRAVEMINDSVSESVRMSLKIFEVYALVSRAMLHLEMNEMESAEAIAHKARERAIEWQFQSVQMWAERVIARVAFATGNMQQAVELGMQARALAQRLRMKPDIAHCDLLLAGFYRQHNIDEKAQEHAGDALQLFESMNMGRWVEEARAMTLAS